MRRIVWIVAALGLLLLGVAGWGYRNGRADPVVRERTVSLPDWPRDARPIRLALLSDIHIGNATMDVDRLARIVAQVNRAHPDVVLLAGDYVAGHDPVVARAGARDMVAPLAGLRAPLGVVAVLGNHDQSEPVLIAAALRRAGVTVLDNAAVVRGPLVIGGAGDAFSHHDDLPATLHAMAGKRGANIILTHSPDLSLQVPPGVGLVLAGHTHCGQGVLPVIGAPRVFWMPGLRCGIIRRGGTTTIITAGLGTSGVPLRFGAPPDLWLVALKGR
jgi:hypothetical protein